MTDYVQDQEMEIEALQAILMDDIKEIHPGESGMDTSNRCFQILLSPQDDDMDASSYIPVQLALIFSHTEKYPDEPPLLNVQSVRGIKTEDIAFLKERLKEESSANLGMAMIYTLVASIKDWLIEKFEETDGAGGSKENDTTKEDIIIPHGEAVTVDTFVAWRERFEAELALEKAKLMPEAVLLAPKEKKLSGRQWFQSGRASVKGSVPITEDSDENDEEEIDFDDDFEDDDEDDMLEHYLAQKS
ncbi:putative Rwd domain-containing protein [Zostera marina]|uniref:Putative Rwd domain-containing protein n=1 Tax=Zostera marina TaxID=29655 RepID=A0A0K9PUJ5_ZOSMR|nr:putative Rwd domain-containing protein [Zostera marina]